MTYPHFDPAVCDPIGPGTKAWAASERYIAALRHGVPSRIRVTKDAMTRRLREAGADQSTQDQWVATAAILAADPSYDV